MKRDLVRRYLRQIDRKLQLPKTIRKRICADLNTTIDARLEAGISAEQILQELGNPDAVAAEFNAQMSGEVQKKHPLCFVCLAAAILAFLVLTGKLAIQFLVTDFINGMTRSVGVIGGADGPTTIFVSSAVSEGFDYGLVFWIALLAAGLIGFVRLYHRK